MPAPSNTSAATAIELGPLPNNIVQDVNDGGTTYTVWYKYVVQDGDNEIGIWANGGFAGGGTSYQVILQVYDGLANATSVTPYLGGFGNGSHPDCPAQIPVDDGQTLYFRLQSANGDVATASLTIDGLIAPQEAVPAGSILVNDHTLIASNTEPLPLVMFSGVDGSLLNFKHPFGSGEQAATLNDGSVLVESVSLSPLALRLYDAELNVTATVVYNHTPVIISSNKIDTFYIGNQDDNTVTTVDATGALGSTTWHPTGLSFSLSFIAPSLDGTILYYAGDNANQPIKRWDLVNDVALSNLAAGAGAGQYVVGILVLNDDTIVVAYQKFGAQNFCKRYATDGTVLNTYNISNSPPDEIGKGAANSQALARSIAADDPNSFWVWVSQDLAVAAFRNIKVSDGSIINSFDVSQFEVGVYEEAATPQPDPDRFGHSDSCPFWIAQQSTVSFNGTIVCTKEIVGEECNDFEFQATGLEPTTFTLSGGDSQTFEDVTPGSGYGLSETVPFGWTSTVTVSNDSDPDNIIVGENETVTVTFTNQRSFHERQRIIRRLRRAPHITQEDKRLFVSQFNLILQPGVGNVADPGLVPKVMLRVSHDAGHTWEPEQEMSAGELGHYRKRVIARQLGQARDLVFEVTVSDPVAWYLVEAFLDVEQGLH